MQYPTCPNCRAQAPATDPTRFTCRNCDRPQRIVLVKPAIDRNEGAKHG